jgi:hypothetical protein
MDRGRYLRKAEHADRLAASAPTPREQIMLRQIADEWRQLALEAELNMRAAAQTK